MTVTENTNEQLANQFVAGIRAVRKIVTSNFSMCHMEVLFMVYLNKGITRGALAELMSYQSASTTYRCVSDLTEHPWKINQVARPSGHRLLTEVDDENDRKLKHLQLNEKGIRVTNEVFENMRTKP